MVNEQILSNKDTVIQEMPLEQATQAGALSLFGEKYDDVVRVLSIGGDFSKELCGGTHVNRAGDIGLFKITAETGVAAGIRRIEAVTGEGALEWVQNNDRILDKIATLLRSDKENAENKLTQQMERSHQLEKEIAQLRDKIVNHSYQNIEENAVHIGELKVLATTLEDADPKALRNTIDRLKQKLGSAVLILASVAKDDQINLVAGVTKDTTNQIKAGELVNFVANKVGGKGGGRPDLAQAGGNNPAALDTALASVPDWVRLQLGIS